MVDYTSLIMVDYISLILLVTGFTVLAVILLIFHYSDNKPVKPQEDESADELYVDSQEWWDSWKEGND